jgi:uncharacterized protein (TIGR02147 family)
MTELDYRYQLKESLVRKIESQPQYSLRAFARDLSLTPSHLSRILNRKSHLSLAAARYVSEKIFKKQNQKDLFVYLVEYNTIRKPQIRNNILMKIKALRGSDSRVQLGWEKFRAISDWYHTAILDLSTIRHLHLSPRNVSRALGITEMQSKLAIDRLVKLNLLVEKNGRLSKCTQTLDFYENAPSAAVRQYHEQMIEKAKTSLKIQKFSERHIESRTIAVRPSDYLELCKLINDFFLKVSVYVENVENPESLFQLNLQLFRLNQRSLKTKKGDL